MAGSSLLALIDDIATVLDDVSVMTRVAAQKTAAVLGDDLALNAQQVAGVRAEREIPVVWAVAKGSLVNKAILVPTALAISALAPWAILPLLMVGGAYLCLEGFEKLVHRALHTRNEDEDHHAELIQALADPAIDLAVLERDKIKGAIRTDFVLSAEIIVITLGVVSETPLIDQLIVLTGIAAVMTIGVYGLVAGIVKMDDAGLYLSGLSGAGAWVRPLRGLGRGLLAAAPVLMKVLAVVGTAAMFLVGGGIITHGIPAAHHLVETASQTVAGLPLVGGGLAWLMPLLMNALVGVLTGAVALLVVTLGVRLRSVIRRWGGRRWGGN
jgi:predicted DNA repair protein MutK